MDGKRAGKLLLVEDEHLLRGLIAQFLRGEGFEVIEAADGSRGRRPLLEPGTVRRRAARPEPAASVRRRSLPPDQERAARPAGHDLQCRDPRLPRRRAARTASRSVPDQALSPAGAAGADRRRDVARSTARNRSSAPAPSRTPIWRVGPGHSELRSDLIPWSSRRSWIKIMACRVTWLSRLGHEPREPHRDHTKRYRFAREGRFHGWETAESTGPAATEGSRRTARSDGGRDRRGRRRGRGRGGCRKEAEEEAEGSRPSRRPSRLGPPSRRRGCGSSGSC